ncbi:MAG: muraminidase [Pseudomonas sp.]|nr:muraminidase [Pseudomonas sp.]
MTRINQATVDLVKEFEGLELTAYRDPVGVLTIGYGYTNQAGYCPGVKPGERWTQAQAEQMLAEGLERFGAQIRPMFTREPNENQFGAFVSLAYNIGVTAFRNSTALRRFNAGDTAGAAEALTWFNKAGGAKLRGLVRRREAERALFLAPPPVRQADPAEAPQGWLAALVWALAGLFKGGKA